MSATAFHMPVSAPSPDPSQASSAPSPAPLQGFRLRRSGQRPLEFGGQNLAMAMSYQIGTPFWFELNLYRAGEYQFVSEIKLFYKSDDEIDQFYADRFDSFDGLMDHLERFDAASIVRSSLPENPAQLSLNELTARALETRAIAAEARRQYRGLVGQLLHELSK